MHSPVVHCFIFRYQTFGHIHESQLEDDVEDVEELEEMVGDVAQAQHSTEVITQSDDVHEGKFH